MVALSECSVVCEAMKWTKVIKDTYRKPSYLLHWLRFTRNEHGTYDGTTAMLLTPDLVSWHQFNTPAPII